MNKLKPFPVKGKDIFAHFQETEKLFSEHEKYKPTVQFVEYALKNLDDVEVDLNNFGFTITASFKEDKE